MRYLFLYFKKRKAMLAAVILMLIGQVVGTLLIPYLIADIIDKGILNADMGAILKTGALMTVTALAASGIAIWGSYLSAEFASVFGKEMREAVFRKTQELSVSDVESFGTASLITRTTSDITNIQQTLVMLLQMIVPAPLIAVASIAMTAMASPVLSLIPICAILLFLLLAGVVLKKSSALSGVIQIRMDRINQVVRESVVGIRVIRAFDNSRYEKKRSDNAFCDYASTMISLNKLFAVLNPIVWLAMGLSMAAIVWFGGMETGSGAMEVGKIMAVSEYTISTLGYLIMAAFSVVMLPKMRACLERLSEVLDKKPEIIDTPIVCQPQNITLSSLTFRNVTFSYPGAEMPVLKQLTFHCAAGQTTAIIGGTGSGKSTVASALLRLHEIDSGQIILNGRDINSMSQYDLRQQIGYVPQKAYLFRGTIEENLRMGDKNASAEKLHHAARIAQAEEFIHSLPGGFHALSAQGGNNFSGGQKQRLSIARALVKHASVYVFDDSFSALDYKTDAALRRALRRELTDSVVLIIAQRISTILDADQIIVLEEGEIAGIGKHNDLMKNCNIYREIAESQLSAEEKIAI